MMQSIPTIAISPLNPRNLLFAFAGNFGFWYSDQAGIDHPLDIQNVKIILAPVAKRKFPAGSLISRECAVTRRNLPRDTVLVVDVCYSDSPQSIPEIVLEFLARHQKPPKTRSPAQRNSQIFLGFGDLVRKQFGDEAGKSVYGEFLFGIKVPYLQAVLDYLKMPSGILAANLPSEFPWDFGLSYLPDKRLVYEYFAEFPEPPDQSAFFEFLRQRVPEDVAMQIFKLCLALGFSALHANEIPPHGRSFTIANGVLFLSSCRFVHCPVVGQGTVSHRTLHEIFSQKWAPDPMFSPLPVISVDKIPFGVFFISQYTQLSGDLRMIALGYALTQSGVIECILVFPPCLTGFVLEAHNSQMWLSLRQKGTRKVDAYSPYGWEIKFLDSPPPPRPNLSISVCEVAKQFVRRQRWFSVKNRR